MKTIENIEAPEPTATPIKRATRRKPRVNMDGTRNGLTMLKGIARNNPDLRDLLYDLSEILSCREWMERVKDTFKVDLGGHRSAVTRFRHYVQTLHNLEDQESRRELILQRYREQFPNETEEQLTQRAILFFKQEAFATGDLDHFIKIGRFSLSVRAQEGKARHQEAQGRLIDAKIRLLDLRIEKEKLAHAIQLLQQAPRVPTPTPEPAQPDTAPVPEVPNVPVVPVVPVLAPEPEAPAATQEYTHPRLSPSTPFPLFPLFPIFPNSSYATQFGGNRWIAERENVSSQQANQDHASKTADMALALNEPSSSQILLRP